MPLTGTGPVLGLTLGVAAGSVDSAGIAAWLAIGNVVATWIPGNTTVKPGSMVAASGKVNGLGVLAFSEETSFGQQLAGAAGVRDDVGREHWIAVGNAILEHLKSNAKATPTLFVSNPQQGGPVTGTGTLAIPNVAVGPALARAAGSQDGPGIAAWAAIGLGLLAHMTANALFLPGVPPDGFKSPPSGPLVGSGKIS